jgi:hypothetical protein
MSGVMFHYSRAMFTNAKSVVPDFDSVMRSNPELKKMYLETATRLRDPMTAAAQVPQNEENIG